MPRRTSDSPTLLDLPPPGPPTDRFERRAKRRGARLVAGVDEAGRGPLAGPVVVAAVVFERGRYPDGLDDSKKLTEADRERLYGLIIARASVAIAIASRERIDRMNILRASLWGMSRAVAGLSCRPDHVLVDGNMLPPNLPCPAEAIVSGDALSLSIAAASIVAKVTRDRLMCCLGRAMPHYRFEEHKGYSTPAHFEALQLHGASVHHRRSFAPVRIALGLEPPTEADLFGEATAAILTPAA
ncbi:MAG TPA: ribonuclease HII [Bauldia sp.]|nr:ribonuclease HII [Bauldia sp.]